MTAREFIKYHLKYNKLIRLVSKPYMIFIANRLQNEYIKSEYCLKMKEYKNKFLGQRCYIIGNGPSLLANDLDKITDEYSFASNRIYEIYDNTKWRPNFYASTDGNFVNENYERIFSDKIKSYFLDYKSISDRKKNENVIGICRYPSFAINRWDDKTIHVSEDLSINYSDGYTVTFTSIQLAIYMGFKEIYLLGVDFSYSIVRDKKGKIHKDDTVKDYFSGAKYESTFQNYSSTLRAYQVAKEYCDSHGIIIKNATRGGKLEVFERVDFDEVLDSFASNCN